MKKNILKLFLVFFLAVFGFASCDDSSNNYWMNSFLDCKLLVTTNQNGYFENYPQEYSLYDLGNISYQEIRLIDAWIDIYGNFNRGDIIEKLEIYVGVGTYVFPADYIIRDSNRIRIDDITAPGYFRFMSDVMRELEYRGRVRIVASGFHNRRYSNLDIVLKNTLDVSMR